MKVQTIVGKAIAYSLTALVLFLILWRVIVGYAEPSQADRIHTIEELRKEMYAIGEQMNQEKMEITAKTCKEQQEAGKADNCPSVF